LDLRNIRPTSFCCQLLRCLECTVSWCTRSVNAVNGRVHGTGCKHGIVQGTRPCTRPCSGHGQTMHGRVHGTYTAVHTGRKDGRVDGRVHGTRPVHGHVYGTYMVGYGPRTRPCFATHRLRTRSCSGHGRTTCMASIRPCTQFVHGRPRPCTYCVHGIARAMYMVRP